MLQQPENLTENFSNEYRATIYDQSHELHE